MDSFLPAESYIGGLPSGGPTVVVGIGKVANGYTLTLQTRPPRKPIRPVPNPFAGMESDEVIDKMVDTIGAFFRSINDKSAGEDWKESGDRQMIREGFRIAFPQLAGHAERITTEEVEQEQPRNETRVFESKTKLMEYLDKNL